MQLAFERKYLNVDEFGQYEDLDVLSFGAKFLLCGTDRSVFNFLQEYVPALLSLHSVKNMLIRKNI